MIDATALRGPPSSGGSYQRRRRRQKRRRSMIDPASFEKRSLLWFLFLVGLLVCLADVAYILHYVDDTKSSNTDHNPHKSSSSRTLRDAVRQSSSSLKNTLEGMEMLMDSNNEEFSNSGLSLEEFMLMNRQLRDHEAEIYTPKAIHRKPGKDEEKPPPLTDVEWLDIIEAKKPILDMLQSAFGLKQLMDLRTEVEPQILRDLPTWEQVSRLYGDKARIKGVEHCEAFQSHSTKSDHFVSVAGTFNSGTNLMSELLIANCHMQDRMDVYGGKNRGVRWQVPWGKHSPVGDEAFRLEHKTMKDTDIEAHNVLPAVTIRDPYVWMNSMCHIEYAAHWHHDPHGHCPNLIPNELELKTWGKFLKAMKPIPVHVKYNGFWKHHESLVGMWNDWYREYFGTDSFPSLIVRYEDLLFHPQEVTETVCRCAGGSLRRDGHFEFVLDSAKKGDTAHGPKEDRTGFLQALIKYGQRTTNPKLTMHDLRYASIHLDKEMMKFFNYKHPFDVDPKARE